MEVRGSPLEQIIPPEIKDDPFYHLIAQIARDEEVRTILEIGASSGGGSTEALVAGLLENQSRPTLYTIEVSRPRFEVLRQRYERLSQVKSYNVSSVPLEQFASADEVRKFYRGTSSALSKYPLDQVLAWLAADIDYVRGSGIAQNGIELVKRENGVTNFDLVLIDGSEFSGAADLDAVYGAGWILLDDINGLKNWHNVRRLLADPRYALVAHDPSLRHGYAVFRRADFPVRRYETIAPSVQTVPGHLVRGQEGYLFDKVRSLPDVAVIVEIGSYKGRSTVAMAHACVGTGRRIFSIDTWNGNDSDFPERDYYDQWQQNLAARRLEQYVTPLRGWSKDVLERWDELSGGRKIDFIFIDGSHVFEDVVVDLRLAMPLVKPAGWIAMHDVCAGWPGPLRAWRRYAGPALAGHEFSTTNQPTLACGRKTETSDELFRHLLDTPLPVLPVHFFTIVLNGEPFIRHHIDQFKKLPFEWHWHVIEGVADLKHDTAWSVAAGGHVPLQFILGGLSTDGTTQYLDELARDYPAQITIHRKPAGKHWEGKLEMVGRAVTDIFEECLLWQVDVDELWTAEQIARAREMFLNNPSKHAAIYRCTFFVGPDLVSTAPGMYGNQKEVWLRTWRFKPGMGWVTHEPPVLGEPAADNQWRDVASQGIFSHDETEAAGLVFQHFAYATERQLHFKEDYYGYKGATARWKALQEASMPARLADFFAWVKDETLVDRSANQNVAPPLFTPEQLTPFNTPLAPPPPLKSIVVTRTDSIGDAIMAASMLERLKQWAPQAKLIMLCQRKVAALYEKCPFVGRIVTFDLEPKFAEPAYREELAQQMHQVEADLCLNTVFSRGPLNDLIATSVNAPIHVAHRGDLSNIDPEARADNDQHYQCLIESPGIWKPEVERHRDFLRGLGIVPGELKPQVWTDEQDARVAEELLASHGLKADKVIALFAGAQYSIKNYPHFAEALLKVCRENDWSVVALGGERESETNRAAIAALSSQVAAVDLSGKTTILEAAEVLRRCRLAIGADTSLAHVACAVGTPNVVVIGGGHFGRFLPYSPLTTVVCLPIHCYGCNWECKYSRPHCVTDIQPIVIEHAIRAVLSEPAPAKPRVFVQDRSMAPNGPNMPNWNWFHHLIERDSIELVTIGRIDAGTQLAVTPIHPPRRHTWSWPDPEPSKKRYAAAAACLQSSLAQLPAAFAHQTRALTADPTVPDLPASSAERFVVDELLSGLARGGRDPLALQYRAAAMLYFRMHEFPAWDPSLIPAWLFDDFIHWTMRSPGMFYEIGEANEHFRRLLEWFTRVRHQLRVAKRDEGWRRMLENVTMRSNFLATYFAEGNLKTLFSMRGDLTELYFSQAGLKPEMSAPPQSKKKGRIRLGIVKRTWQPDPETFATLPFFRHLPRDCFEVVLYTLKEDALDAPCRKAADRFVVLPTNWNAQAELLRRERCDVLLFAQNMTAVATDLSPLAAHRVAPIQATNICAPSTSALPKMDVFFAGELTEPRDDAQDMYREKLIKLPGSGLCFDYSLRPPPSHWTISRAALKVNDSTVVFASGANFNKILPEVRRTWARILSAVPDSILVLYPFGPAWGMAYPLAAFVRCFNEELQNVGVDPGRLYMLNPMQSSSDVKQIMAIADVYLDSFPYTGATSLLDPLEAGVPTITMEGDRLRFAQGSAMLKELGVPDLIAASPEHYIELAVKLATDMGFRTATRETVTKKMSRTPPFLDGPAFGAKVAAALQTLVDSKNW